VSYDYWHAELAAPGSKDRLNVSVDDIWGYWRIQGARTKPDYPFAAWQAENGTVFKFGRKPPFDAESVEGQNALSFSFPHAIAVSETEYKTALIEGTWSDGKPSRQPGAIADERPEEGQSNYAPVHEVLQERIESIIEKIKALDPVDTQEKADKLSGLGQELKAAITEATGAYSALRKPHDDALAVVSANYVFIKSGENMLAASRTTLRDFLRKEEARLAEEARKSSEVQGSAGEAKAEGVPTPKAKASSAFGRATVLRTVKKGVITDRAKFLRAVKDDADITDLLQRKANALARAGTKKPGMEIEESRE